MMHSAPHGQTEAPVQVPTPHCAVLQHWFLPRASRLLQVPLPVLPPSMQTWAFWQSVSILQHPGTPPPHLPSAHTVLSVQVSPSSQVSLFGVLEQPGAASNITKPKPDKKRRDATSPGKPNKHQKAKPGQRQ